MSARNSEEARARAEERFERLTNQQKQAEQVHKEREKAAKATAERMEQLRALRLARDAEQESGLTDAQREAAAEAEQKRAELLAYGQPPKPPVPRRRRTARTTH